MIAIDFEKITSLSQIITKIDTKRFYVVVDRKVYTLYQTELTAIMASPNCLGSWLLYASEQKKTLASCDDVLSHMLEHNVQRDDCIIAIGGGITTDLAGFVASIYKRGIDWYAVPTTLLGMVDAAIGGKTGVNAKFIKNAYGSFHFPKNTFYWFDFLASLSDEQRINGFGECVKYGYIGDCFSNLSLLDVDDYCVSDELIMQYANYKKNVVLMDAKEQSIRKYLNFGHTLGHVIEKSPYNQIVGHGIAVMYGMAYSLFLSVELAGLDVLVFNQYLNWLMIQPFYKRQAFPKMTVEMMALKNDKKNSGDRLTMVVLESIGSPQLVQLSYKEFEVYYDAFLRIIAGVYAR